MANNELETLLAPILKEFTERVAMAVEDATLARVRIAVDSAFEKKRDPSPASTPTGRRVRTNGARTTRRTPRGVPANPKLVETRRVQGVYMGLLRNFKGTARAQVKAAAAKDGVAAGVELARRLLAKRT